MDAMSSVHALTVSGPIFSVAILKAAYCAAHSIFTSTSKLMSTTVALATLMARTLRFLHPRAEKGLVIKRVIVLALIPER